MNREPWTVIVEPLRACQLCRHGVDVDATRCCTCKEVVGSRAPQPVALVRAPHGACGPEANWLDFPGLRP